MTREARLTQKRLEGEILKLLEGEDAQLLSSSVKECSFCRKYAVIKSKGWYFGEEEFYTKSCGKCPVLIGLKHRCYQNGPVNTIDDYMRRASWFHGSFDKAIPGALAIYLWLEEL